MYSSIFEIMKEKTFRGLGDKGCFSNSKTISTTITGISVLG